ncbi:hypothetical protein PtA15_10A554 [Puccinia triticina]|uniref:Uncharacterized protein n=1 Tax=Puccinia triticina TaxID=208348 RepID=A0ABY7CWV2_9BASI|nr:uncharacterized protein PtA15_10A554 [Puccinia triticina]WAQ89130.1 hypothetical protein PtA15_10A554 [Puccinia triticina]WAR59189.1 hypothetical protein PtB15_10B531 [Puccinia triticina]
MAGNGQDPIQVTYPRRPAASSSKPKAPPQPALTTHQTPRLQTDCDNDYFPLSSCSNPSDTFLNYFQPSAYQMNANKP